MCDYEVEWRIQHVGMFSVFGLAPSEPHIFIHIPIRPSPPTGSSSSTMVHSGVISSDVPQLRKSDGTQTPNSEYSEDLEKPGASTFTQDCVFDDPVLAEFYSPPDNYESRHRFDPAARWSQEEEDAVRRKCDWRVCTFVCICFAALQLDRGNITNAISDNMLHDLGMTTAEYNLGQTIFYVCFLFMELPSQLISKKLGVDRWVPFQMVMWSVVATCQCKLTGKKSFYATRALLGALEGGFIPDMILYLSYFYTGAELTVRMSFFWVAQTITTILGSLVAAGILQMRGIGGWTGWQYLFLIEGLITLAVGIFAAFWLPPSVTQTAGGIRGKGWFTEREETIIVTRVLRDDPTKSSMHNREAIGFKALWQALTDYDHIPIYALGLTTYIAPGTVKAYFTLTLKSFGFNTFHTNLLTIPGDVLFIINNLGISMLSRRFREHSFIASLGSWWLLITFIALVSIPNDTAAWAKYAIFVLILGYPYAHPIIVSWNSRNSGSVRTRSVSASLYNIAVQLGNIISSNIYQPSDKPYYNHGNRVLLGIISANLVLFGLTKVWYIYRNKQKAKVWEALSAEERANYLATTKDEGNRRLDFQFVH
ncbi:hypothetical protein P7C70_g171, partial [Phenoliferia sp. Uapishka_3]